jgi:hypothetical protein
MLSRLAESDPAFSAQLAQTAWLWIQADELTQDVCGSGPSRCRRSRTC